MKNLNDTKAGHDCVRRIMNGERQAENDFFNYFFEKLNNYFRWQFKIDETTANDLSIEVLTKSFVAFRNGKFTPDFKVSTWLYKIAYRRAVDYFRMKKLNKVYSIEDLGFDNDEGDELQFQIISHEPNSDELLDKKYRKQALLNAIKKLPKAYQELIHYRYFKEYKYEECAKEFGKNLGTIKGQIFRAKTFLSIDSEIKKLKAA